MPKNLISWQTDSISEPVIDKPLLEQWIESVASDHSKVLGPVTYIFCNDEKILEVNREFLQHDYYTDIITFDYTRGRRISGDLFISLDTVRSNAELVNATYEEELHRVIIHGILHLCGINDKGPGEREVMEAHENAALAKLNVSRETNKTDK